MDPPSSYTNRFRQLRWKLTLSYTGVTVGALLTVELILLAGATIVVAVLLNSGILQADLVNAVSNEYMPSLQFLLSHTPSDQDEITNWLERLGAADYSTPPFTFKATDQMFIVGPDGVLLGSRPPDLLGSGTIGHPVNMQALQGLAAPLQAALGGEDDVDKLYTLPGPDETVIIAIPIWNEVHERVLGVLVGVGKFPTVQSVFSSIIPILGGSLLVFTLIAAIAGTIYGSVAARGLSNRLDRLSEGTHAWSQGDFTQLVEDTSRDEIGQLAYNLNQMAGQLQQLMETRRELVVVNERNRLARELHDSAKQQAFAAAAQLSAARKLMPKDPGAAENRLEEAERLIDDLRKELTILIQELRPAALEGKGLAAAVRNYGEDWSRQNGIELDLRVKGEKNLPLKVEQAIFRIVQEGLANISRHSNANKAEIELLYTNKELTCTIRDNGKGFDPSEIGMGFGIRSMQERANSLGSQIHIESIEGKGTTITLAVMPDNFRQNKEILNHD